MKTLNFTSVHYGYEKIYGFSGGGIENVRNEVKNYNLNSILETCSKIALKTTTKPLGFSDPSIQIELTRDIFADDLDVRKRIVNSVRAGKTSNWVVFSEQSLLLLIKISLENAKTKGGKLITEDKVGKLGHWLLKLADECYKTTSIVIPKSLQREEIREILARQYFFLAKERLAYKLVRFNELFKIIKKISPKFPLEKTFKKATGTELRDYYNFCFYLLVNWVNKVNKKPDMQKEWWVCKEKYFEKTKLKEEKIDDLLGLMLLDVKNFSEKYKKIVKEILDDKDVYELNFLSLQKKPLIPINDECFVAPSKNLLMEKATEGSYWILNDYLKDTDKKLWKALPSVMGEALEVYAHTILESIFGQDSYVKNPKVKKQETIDGVGESKSHLFFTEVKFAHWSYKALLTGEKESMSSSLSQLFGKKGKNKGLGQILRAIELYRSEKLVLPFGKENKQIIPLLIVGEQLPMDDYNRRLYEDIAAQSQSLPTTKMPFIVLHIEELEMLEAIAKKQGKEVALELLTQYSSLFLQRTFFGYTKNALPFKNFLYDINFDVPNNKRLLAKFDKLANSAAIKAFGEKIHKKG